MISFATGQGSVVVLPRGEGSKVVRILRIEPGKAKLSKEPSGDDRIELEGVRIGGADMQRLALLFPNAQLYSVLGGKAIREKLEVPKSIPALLKCPNPNCVTVQPREPVKAGFWVVKTRPLTLQCNYCERYVDSEFASAQLLGP